MKKKFLGLTLAICLIFSCMFVLSSCNDRIKVGVQTGSVFDQVAEKNIENCQVKYYYSTTDLGIALESGKISCYLADEPLAQLMLQKYSDQRIERTLQDVQYAYVFPKNNERSTKICNQINEFLNDCKTDGTLEELRSAWVLNDSTDRKVNMADLTGENGTINMAICSSVGAPFIYISNNEFAGYDIELTVKFCEAYGYKLNIHDFDISGMFSSVTVGKCDLAASCIGVTEERKETMMFSDGYYNGGIVVVVKDSSGSESGEEKGFWASIADSLNKTFIRENRYVLFLSGIGITLLIVILSVMFGSGLGLLVYVGYYKYGKVYRNITDAVIKITENTPIVIILMILYYVIFGSASIDGMWVSIIGFSFIFMCTVVGLVKVGVGAVDSGQREAALALGYSENKTLFRFILPQASRHFLPGYKSAIVQLIKETAIVGYIAVQDLTKVSDIIRSRTYEAFVPLIVSAILYFGIAMLATAIVQRVEVKFDPKLRSKDKILKGVNVK